MSSAYGGVLNGVFIIPTGLGCALGGDAAYNPGVKLIAACSDNLIVNPNAVNASDINEIPTNGLYVEGSTIDRFLEGKINLTKVRTYNRILMVANSASAASLNSMNAGIWGLGANINILPLNTPLEMVAHINPDGTAGGTYSGVDELINQVKPLDFDALAIQTPIQCDKATSEYYWQHGGVNPWGGIEAIVSKEISTRLNKPVAHAPVDTPEEFQIFDKFEVKKTMAPEAISNTYMFCVLKGLHKSPGISLDLENCRPNTLTNKDIAFLVSPHGCFGRPHWACYHSGIPIIVVKENTTCFSRGFSYPVGDGIIFVENYLEAAGLIMSMGCGVDYHTVLLDK